MKTQLLIARHGNTFLPGEAPRRVGARTDLPLVETLKASAIGDYLKQNFEPDAVYSSPLKRTMETATIALQTAGFQKEIITEEIFREIDYGPDENKTEPEVIERIGTAAINAWNTSATVPPGWDFNPEEVKQNWLNFAQNIITQYQGKKILVITSNGIARFAPVLLNLSPEALSDQFPSLKVGTGHLCLFEFDGKQWECDFWNKRV